MEYLKERNVHSFITCGVSWKRRNYEWVHTYTYIQCTWPHEDIMFYKAAQNILIGHVSGVNSHVHVICSKGSAE